MQPQDSTGRWFKRCQAIFCRKQNLLDIVDDDCFWRTVTEQTCSGGPSEFSVLNVIRNQAFSVRAACKNSDKIIRDKW